MIFNMNEEDFDDVVRVHLKGHFCTSRHVGRALAQTRRRRPNRARSTAG